MIVGPFIRIADRWWLWWRGRFHLISWYRPWFRIGGKWRAPW